MVGLSQQVYCDTGEDNRHNVVVKFSNVDIVLIRKQ